MGVCASVGVWIEALLAEVEGTEVSNVFTTPKLAFVGRVLPGLRFGASKRLIFGSRSQAGFRMAFGREPEPAGLGCGNFFGDPNTPLPDGAGIRRVGDLATGDWAEEAGAGEEGAENRDDGEPYI